jgi:hypothetical protein
MRFNIFDVIAREGGRSSNHRSRRLQTMVITGCPAFAGHDKQ